MADVAHDASGPASSEPAGVTQQQANRPVSSDKEKLRVFISYSRDDLKFADQLDAALNACGFECLIDRHGISGGEDWKRRLGNLIREADTVVFMLSPSSARSEVCAWEVEEAARLNKRIFPVNCRPLEGASPPQRLRDLNYVFFYEDPKVSDSGFGSGLAKLVAALNTDFDWLREHTRYLQRATEWDGGGRPANRLLSGDDIAEAKAWVARRPKNAPEPTALHLDFIRASEEEAEARSSEQRKQLEAMAAAQAERETALREAEEAQRKRATMARIRNIALVAVSLLAVLAGSLYSGAISPSMNSQSILPASCTSSCLMLMIWSSRARNRSPDPVVSCFFGRIAPSDAATESCFSIRGNRENEFASFQGLRRGNLAISSQQSRQKTTLAQWVRNSSRATALVCRFCGYQFPSEKVLPLRQGRPQ